MTREEAIEVLEKMKYPQKVNKNGFVISNVDIDNEALEMAIKALSQEPTTPMSTFAIAKQFGIKLEPCDDAISREAVNTLYDKWRPRLATHVSEFGDELKALPSVMQKSGKWLEKDGYDGDTYYDCSVCGESWSTIEGTPWDNGMKYCPNCGAKMESEDEGC